MAADPHSPPPFFSRQNLWYWVRLIAVVLVIKGCVVDQYRIPSQSMEPTLHAGSFFEGDRILVNKWTMGPRIPFTTVRLWDWYTPKRWDIVVFRSIEPGSKQKVLVKRVVGLPGEKVQIHFGGILIDGKKVEKPASMPPNHWYNSPEDIPKIKDPSTQEFFTERNRQDPMRYGVGKDDQNTVVPEGHYLMLGDNSTDSHDGRMYGWVPRDNIFGPVFAIWWPFPRMHDFTGFSQTWWGPFAIYGPVIGLLTWILWDVISDVRRAVRRTRPKPGDDTG